MGNQCQWSQLDELLYEKYITERKVEVSAIPKICHHAPTSEDLSDKQVTGLERHRREFCLQSYVDQETPGIYVCGFRSRRQVLVDHPEIRFFACVGFNLDEKDELFPDLQGNDRLIARGFEIIDYDRRSSWGLHAPDEENVRPIVDFLQEWHASGAPSFLIHCAAGQYRSAATALAAHSLITRDPKVSATRMVMAEWGHIDSNWEIARLTDAMLGFEGNLHSAAVNVQRAVAERERLLKDESDLEKVLDKIMDIFHNPWDEEKAAAHFAY